MGAVRGAEGVVDVDIGEPGERAASSGSFFVSPGSKRLFSSTRIDPGSSSTGERLDLVADDGGRELDRRPTSSPSRSATGGIESSASRSLGPAEVRDEDERGAALEQQLDRRQRRPDPRVVGDGAPSPGRSAAR